MKIKEFCLSLSVSFFIIFFLSSCNIKPFNFLSNSNEKKNIIIAVPTPIEYAQNYTNFLNGIEIIKDEIANHDIDINLDILIEDDKNDFSTAIRLSEKYSEDSNVIGVVGHWNTEITLAMSDIYERNKTVMLSHYNSTPALIKSDSNYIFQNIPTDIIIGKDLCDLSKKLGNKNVVLYYDEDIHGQIMSANMEIYANKIGLNILDKFSGTIDNQQLQQLSNKWDLLNYDAVILSTTLESGVNMINRMYNINPKLKFFTSDNLDSNKVISMLGDAGNNTIISSLYNNNIDNDVANNFRKKYIEKYNEEPDSMAIYGYDSLKIISDSVIYHGIRTSEDLKNYLSNTETISSIFGEISFKNSHEVEGRQVYNKTIENSNFKYID